MTFQPLKTVDYCCILLLAESGYQGMHNHNKNLILPVKKKKGLFLSAEDQAHNKALSKQRVFIKLIKRRGKFSELLKLFIGGKHKTYWLTCNLVAALVNLRYAFI
ncbi:MAG: hypothetical protein QX198_06775 [Methylococcaceae bacterium]